MCSRRGGCTNQSPGSIGHREPEQTFPIRPEDELQHCAPCQTARPAQQSPGTQDRGAGPACLVPFSLLPSRQATQRASRAFLDSFCPKDILANPEKLLVVRPKLCCHGQATLGSRLSGYPHGPTLLTKPVDSVSGRRWPAQGKCPELRGTSAMPCGLQLPLCPCPA